MVQAIVSNHEGYFGLASQEGRGTTATVRLPVQREVGPRTPDSSEEQTVPVQR